MMTDQDTPPKPLIDASDDDTLEDVQEKLKSVKEVGGSKHGNPTVHGDWQTGGRTTDF